MAVDILPFPNITAQDAETQIKQLIDYLAQFKEDLEFILSALQDGEALSAKTIEEVTQARATDPNITVQDVIGSYAFKNAINTAKELRYDEATGDVIYSFEEGD